MMPSLKFCFSIAQMQMLCLPFHTIMLFTTHNSTPTLQPSFQLYHMKLARVSTFKRCPGMPSSFKTIILILLATGLFPEEPATSPQARPLPGKSTAALQWHHLALGSEKNQQPHCLSMSSEKNQWYSYQVSLITITPAIIPTTKLQQMLTKKF